MRTRFQIVQTGLIGTDLHINSDEQLEACKLRTNCGKIIPAFSQRSIEGSFLIIIPVDTDIPLIKGDVKEVGVANEFIYSSTTFEHSIKNVSVFEMSAIDYHNRRRLTVEA